MDKKINVRHLQRKGTEAEWNSEGAVKLLNGELGYATDTKILKMGDGEHLWKDLSSIANLVEVDEKTISKNAEDKIQSIGVMEKNKNTPSYDWVGTEKEYNALGTYNNDWTYYITDDYTEAGGGNGATTIDNTTITKNTAGDIQTVAIKEQNSSVAVYDWVGTEKEYLELSEYHDDWKYYITDDYFDSPLSVHNPGDIFFTIRTDSLPGAVDANGGEYTVKDYSGEKAVGKLLESGALPYVSKTEFANLVSENGYCEKFGWNGASDTTFLVPNVRTWSTKNIIPVAGNGMTLGLTDGTNNAGLTLYNQQYGQYDGANKNAYGTNVGTTGMDGAAQLALNTTQGITIDPTKSGIVADASTRSTVRAMVQLVTAVADEALENYSSLKSDVVTLKTEITEKEDTTNKVTKITSSSTDSQYPSAKAVVNYINGSASSGSGGVSVGSVFVTPRTGLIPGAVEANGGEYKIGDYSGESSIGTLLTAGNIAYVSKEEFGRQVSWYGACESFGWDGPVSEALYAWSAVPEVGFPTIYTKTPTPSINDNTYYQNGNVAATITAIGNNSIEVGGSLVDGEFNRDSANDIADTADTTFLVPKINPWHIKKSAPVVGNGMTLGLTDGTNKAGLYYSGNSTMTYRPDVLGKPAGTSDSGSSPATSVSLGVTKDPTNSGVIADLSETTNLRVMVQLVTGATDEALETCTSVLADVSELKDLSNLTSTGKNIANWSSNVTNCLTEIPQDIKLELNNGTLTLKAGSKVYVPNGAGVFDVVTIANDITMDGGAATGAELVYVTVNTNLLYHYNDNSSGTDWTATSQYQCRYNTSANMIKNTNNTGSTWEVQLSFPIAKITLSSGTVTSIVQIFNGLGYIGSTVFALPGVKGLIPNGRNPDGTLKNTTASLTSVQTKTFTNQAQTIAILIGNNYLATGIFPYDEKTNYNYNATIAPGNERTQVNAGSATVSSGTITSFNPKTVFHAADYSSGDYVIDFQAPTAANSYTWYRKYKSGWVEQGGCYENATDAQDITTRVTLPITMADNLYTAIATAGRNTDNAADRSGYTSIFTQTTTTLGIGWYGVNSTNTMRRISWQVSGMAA